MIKIISKLIPCFYAPLALLCVHIILGGMFGAYLTWPRFDMLMHFFGGFSMGLTGILLLRVAEKEKWLQINETVLHWIISVCFVTLTIVVWELLEFTSDQLLGTRMQPSLRDTMEDCFLGLVGGMIASILFLKKVLK
jgi:hypothetical protein